MQVGWPGLSRAIAFSIVLTSMFWIALGIWLFRTHVASDHAQRETQLTVGSPPPSATLRGPRQEEPPRVGEPSSRPPTYRGLQGLTIPVAGVAPDKLVDTFAQGRAEGARRHDAIDIPSVEGTPVLAAVAGRVEKLFESKDGGNTIYVRGLDRRTIYYYAHLSAYARGLIEGSDVRSGQFLGTVGHTGNADARAPHLHFAVWNVDPAQGWSQQGQAIDPYPLLTRKTKVKP